MFLRKLTVERIDATGTSQLLPIAQLDNFAMRNSTNDAIFDGTRPSPADCSKPGNRIPLNRLTSAMEEWFRRKSCLTPTDHLRITELPR